MIPTDHYSLFAHAFAGALKSIVMAIAIFVGIELVLVVSLALVAWALARLRRRRARAKRLPRSFHELRQIDRPSPATEACICGRRAREGAIAHRHNCPCFTQLDLDWCIAQWSPPESDRG